MEFNTKINALKILVLELINDKFTAAMPDAISFVSHQNEGALEIFLSRGTAETSFVVLLRSGVPNKAVIEAFVVRMRSNLEHATGKAA